MASPIPSPVHVQIPPLPNSPPPPLPEDETIHLARGELNASPSVIAEKMDLARDELNPTVAEGDQSNILARGELNPEKGPESDPEIPDDLLLSIDIPLSQREMGVEDRRPAGDDEEEQQVKSPNAYS